VLRMRCFWHHLLTFVYNARAKLLRAARYGGQLFTQAERQGVEVVCVLHECVLSICGEVSAITCVCVCKCVSVCMCMRVEWHV